MNNAQEFNKIMEKTINMALATSIDNTPNVRIVSFCYDTNKPGIVYFTTIRDNPKTTEFEKNAKVAFTTIPTEGWAHVRATNAIITRSPLSINEIKPLFLAQVPGFDETLSQVEELLDVYEIHIKKAVITLGIDQTDIEMSFQ